MNAKKFFYVEWLHPNTDWGWTGDCHPDIHGYADYRKALAQVVRWLPQFPTNNFRIRHGREVVSLWVKGQRIKRSRIANAR